MSVDFTATGKGRGSFHAVAGDAYLRLEMIEHSDKKKWVDGKMIYKHCVWELCVYDISTAEGQADCLVRDTFSSQGEAREFASNHWQSVPTAGPPPEPSCRKQVHTITCLVCKQPYSWTGRGTCRKYCPPCAERKELERTR